MHAELLRLPPYVKTRLELWPSAETCSSTYLMWLTLLPLGTNRQLLVDKRLLRENAKRIRHDYAVGDLVWKKNHLGLSDKLKYTVSGPYPITQVHTNGTVVIQLSPNVTERINIRRIRPKKR